MPRYRRIVTRKKASRVQRYVGFGRTYDSKPDEGIEFQRTKCLLHCNLTGAELVAFRFDTHKSTRKAGGGRGALDRLMDFLAREDIDGLIVYSMDRCWRSTKDFLRLMHEVRHRDKTFIAVEDGIDTTTKLGRFFLEKMGRLAELEAERDGLVTVQAQLKEQRLAYNAKAPFGLMQLGGRLVEVPEEMDTVRRIAFLRMCPVDSETHGASPDDQGLSYSAIAKSLNAERRHIRGKKWFATQVQRVCDNLPTLFANVQVEIRDSMHRHFGEYPGQGVARDIRDSDDDDLEGLDCDE